ncbi:MAG: sulfite exporter TauE/SafE family protein, partial [bacterium]
VARHHRAVIHSVLWRNILPAAGIGLIIGAALFNFIRSETLAFAYGAFVLLFSTFELSRAVRSVPNKDFSWLQGIFWLLSGGIIQGIYASGGPLTVFYATRKLHDKGNFRSTLSALWLILNIVLLISHILTGKTTMITITSSATLLPAMVVGIIIGERLHNLIPAKAFRIFIFIVLIAAGASLILRLYNH